MNRSAGVVPGSASSSGLNSRSIPYQAVGDAWYALPEARVDGVERRAEVEDLASLGEARAPESGDDVADVA